MERFRRQQVSVLVKFNSLVVQQGAFFLQLGAVCFSGVAAEGQVAFDHAVAWHLRGKWVPFQCLPDGLGGTTVERTRHGGIRHHLASGNLADQIVDALLKYCGAAFQGNPIA